MVFVTHDLREAAYLANRICVMSARPGRILEDCAVEFARPRTLELTFGPEFTALREKGAQHPIEATGRELRKLMAWVDTDRDADYVEGSAAR